MKQASGLLGTRGCPGLTISKPRKLKVRSRAAAGNTWSEPTPPVPRARGRGDGKGRAARMGVAGPRSARAGTGRPSLPPSLPPGAPTSVVAVLVEADEDVVGAELLLGELQQHCEAAGRSARPLPAPAPAARPPPARHRPGRGASRSARPSRGPVPGPGPRAAHLSLLPSGSAPPGISMYREPPRSTALQSTCRASRSRVCT